MAGVVLQPRLAAAAARSSLRDNARLASTWSRRPTRSWSFARRPAAAPAIMPLRRRLLAGLATTAARSFPQWSLPQLSLPMTTRDFSVGSSSGPGITEQLQQQEEEEPSHDGEATTATTTIPTAAGHDGEDGSLAASTGGGGGEAEAGLPPGITSSGDKMIIAYTCNVCETRSARTISKNAYEHGTVLLKCPGCGSLHLIADRLGTFEEGDWDIVQHLKDRGDDIAVVRDGDILEVTETRKE